MGYRHLAKGSSKFYIRTLAILLQLAEADDYPSLRAIQREFTLHYGDLDTSLGQPPPVLS